MSPAERDDVWYIDSEECAYVLRRYRECHDIYHAILGILAFIAAPHGSFEHFCRCEAQVGREKSPFWYLPTVGRQKWSVLRTPNRSSMCNLLGERVAHRRERVVEKLRRLRDLLICVP